MYVSFCRQLYAGHVVGSWPVERKEKNALIKLFNNKLYSFNYTCGKNNTA